MGKIPLVPMYEVSIIFIVLALRNKSILHHQWLFFKNFISNVDQNSLNQRSETQ